MEALKRFVKKLLKYRFLYSGLSPIKTSKRAFLEMSKHYEEITSKIASEIVSKQNGSFFKTGKKTKCISGYEIVSAVGDSLGEVINYNGTIFRGIKQSGLENFKILYEMGFYQTLIKYDLLCPFSITNLYSDDYPVILQPEYLFVVSPTFWNSRTLALGSKHIAIIQAICKKCDVMFYDGHIFNVSSSHGKLLYIDIGSFLYLNKFETSSKDFSNSVNLYTLLLKQFDHSSLKYIGFNSQYFNTIDSKAFVKSIEISHIYSAYYNYHLLHSKKYVSSVIKSCFLDYNIRPETIDLLFQKQFNSKEYTFQKNFPFPNINASSPVNSVIYIGTNPLFLSKIIDSLNPNRMIIMSKEDEILNTLQIYSQKNKFNCEFYCVNPFFETPETIKKSVSSEIVIVDESLNKEYRFLNPKLLVKNLLQLGKKLIISDKRIKEQIVNNALFGKYACIEINDNYCIIKE